MTRVAPILALAFLVTGGLQAEETADELVRLPPLLIEQTAMGRTWRFAEIPGLQVLARCSDADARDAAHAFLRARAALNVLLPPQILATTDLPNTLILYDEDLLTRNGGEAVRSMLEASGQPIGVLQTSTTLDTARRGDLPIVTQDVPGLNDEVGPTAVLRNLRLSDVDASVSFAVVQSLRTASQHVTPESLGEMLGRRVPALPSWFVAGFLSLYRKIDFGGDALALPPLSWPSTPGDGGRAPVLGLTSVLVTPAVANGPGPGASFDLWVAHAELLIRWALAGDESRRQAFWQLVGRTATEPLTDALVKECLATTSEQLTADVATFLKKGATKRQRWEIPRSVLPALAFRDAEPNEVARIKGDWERLETRFVRQRLPLLQPAYLEQTRRTLRRTETLGASDPQLFAVLGLTELEAGDTERAKSLLALAVAGNVVRPRAYLELARLQFEECRPRFAGANTGLSGKQARKLQDLIQRGCRQAPPLSDAYALLLAVWQACDEPPDVSDLALLETGAEQFPANVELAAWIAEKHLALGSIARAATILRRAEPQARTEESRARLAALRAVLPN